MMRTVDVAELAANNNAHCRVFRTLSITIHRGIARKLKPGAILTRRSINPYSIRIEWNHHKYVIDWVWNGQDYYACMSWLHHGSGPTIKIDINDPNCFSQVIKRTLHELQQWKVVS